MSTLAVRTLTSTHIVQTLVFDESKIIDSLRIHLLKNGILNNCTINFLFMYASGELAGFPAGNIVKLESTELNKLPKFWHGLKYVNCKDTISNSCILIKKPDTVEDISIDLHIWLTGTAGTDTNFVGLVINENPTTKESIDGVWDNGFGLELYTLK